MLAVLRLGPTAYGATIVEELERRTGRPTSPGAVYVALRRLERKGMVSSRLGAPSPTRGGRPKRFFTVGANGTEALRRARSAWDAMAEGLDALLESDG